jgi:hypothetical protein
MADDIAMVERIYERAGIDLTEKARSQLDAHMVEHPRGRHGQIAYDLQGQFGMAPADARAHFDFYFERFDVRAEA